MKSHNADIIMPILAASVLASTTPGLPALLALRTTAPWPMLLLGFFTGHLVHWTFEHFFYDALCFAVMASRIPRRQLLAALPVSALAVSLTVILFHPELPSYGGLSGIGCCLFILFAWNLFQHIKPLAYLALAGILLKTIAECTCGRTFFATTGFIPVHAAHFAGAFTGIALLFLGKTFSSPRG
ncbi:MAG: hypothetical protein MJ202_00355 [Lentisphaeria bacterium]|nr:hypothetical protein [Lentisphaeria bacterium]